MNTKKREVPDLTAVLPQSKRFKLDNKEYSLIYGFREIAKLEELYDNVGNAIEALYDQKQAYKAVLDFLYIGLGEKYDLTMQNIEEWIGLGSAALLRDIVVEAVMLSYGKMQTNEEDDGRKENDDAGEV